MAEQAEHRKPVRLATAAFQAAVAENWDAAQRALQRLGNECGEEGVVVALVALCDTFADHASGGGLTPQPVRITFWDAQTGQLDGPGSEQVPVEAQWASRLIAARAAMDEAAFRAVLDELPHDEKAVGRHVWSLLQAVAWQQKLPRGYARMGQGGSDG